ncbi:hypothetical protein PDE_02526 [Penicillium oxalicum 114-2]|uniref:J domain-containing protein n=1 Tax=Penicillium oxalicum (strain 114-2 / CGMCC 5302) TaxID=933388 RepID=S8ANU2_PENO1|nr:hypothetical protein PDE_02526 [Penicillium oxalicum 114-2]
MKTAVLSLFLLAFVGLVAAWSKEDYEIFRLRDELITAEGANVTFYEYLDIRPNANQDQIIKAHRKKSRDLHPDKVRRSFIANYSKDKAKAKSAKGVNVNKGPSKREVDAAIKEANARSARLNLVANVLKGPGRERYDHFLKNGFPLWKGTGYYYSRFRPGLGSVLLGLFLFFGGAAHYGALYLSWKREREFVDRYLRQARRAAWGDELGVRGIPGLDSAPTPAPVPTAAPGSEMPEAGAVAMNRRQKRMMDKENRKEKKAGRPANRAVGSASASGTSTPTEQSSVGERKRVVAENGKVLIVDSIGNVFLEEVNEDGAKGEFLLDIDNITRPSLRDTAVCRLPVWVYGKTIGRLLGSSKAPLTDSEIFEDLSAGEEIVEDAADAADKVQSQAPRRRRVKGNRRS